MTNSTNGRAEHRRLNNGDKANIRQRNGKRLTVEAEVDNALQPLDYLIMKVDSHICCELVTAKVVVACLYKHCFKGRDMAKAKIIFEENEIEACKKHQIHF